MAVVIFVGNMIENQEVYLNKITGSVPKQSRSSFGAPLRYGNERLKATRPLHPQRFYQGMQKESSHNAHLAMEISAVAS